ncbi:hypothetical protein RRF57_002415 [Xylaria bambusicola]|uniref:Major facilitator superfamily (MFS) profile domain-containing protein n=1 Tax=Xylaria bambusicola TaxID=326684 RepID=A0AAN7U6A4_9PEZI
MALTSHAVSKKSKVSQPWRAHYASSRISSREQQPTSQQRTSCPVSTSARSVVSGRITVIPLILMATIRVGGIYWTVPFFALLSSPLSADVLFTVSNLVISDEFSPEVQSTAGGVFNGVAQFGKAVGLAVTTAIASSVMDHSN